MLEVNSGYMHTCIRTCIYTYTCVYAFSERHTEKLHLSKTQRKQRTRKGRVGAVSTEDERSGETEGHGRGRFRKKEMFALPSAAEMSGRIRTSMWALDLEARKITLT